MSDKRIAIDAEDFGRRVLVVLQGEAKGAWDKLNAEEKRVFEAASVDAGKLAVREASGETVPDAEWAVVGATFENLKVAAVLVVRQAFWRSVSRVFGALLGAIPGIVSRLALG